MNKWHYLLAVGLLGNASTAVQAAQDSPESPEAKLEAQRLDHLPPVAAAAPGHIDHSGRKEKGGASFYAKSFAHRKMADGRRMDPNADVAASKTLPLGSVAKVTNLDNGKSATVKIEDRGPYVSGRVVDLSPKIASDLDLNHKGVAPVEVKPITLPQADGGVKLGAGAAESTPTQVHQAVEDTRELTRQKTDEETAKK